jgi:hypothetical protein
MRGALAGPTSTAPMAACAKVSVCAREKKKGARERERESERVGGATHGSHPAVPRWCWRTALSAAGSLPCSPSLPIWFVSSSCVVCVCPWEGALVWEDPPPPPPTTPPSPSHPSLCLRRVVRQPRQVRVRPVVHRRQLRPAEHASKRFSRWLVVKYGGGQHGVRAVVNVVARWKLHVRRIVEVFASLSWLVSGRRRKTRMSALVGPPSTATIVGVVAVCMTPAVACTTCTRPSCATCVGLQLASCHLLPSCLPACRLPTACLLRARCCSLSAVVFSCLPVARCCFLAACRCTAVCLPRKGC